MLQQSVTTVLAAVEGGHAAAEAGIPPVVWGALAYLVFGSYLLAFGCYVWLLDKCPAERVTTYAYVNPLVAVLLGWLLAGEPLTAGMGFAAALILGAVALAVSRPA